MTAKGRLGGEVSCDCVVDVMVRALLKNDGQPMLVFLYNRRTPALLRRRQEGLPWVSWLEETTGVV
jgi:hypothetical protein